MTSEALLPQTCSPRGEVSTDTCDAIGRRLLAALSRLAPGSRRAYDGALRRFAEFVASVGIPDMASAVSDRQWWNAVLALVARGRLATADAVDQFAVEACAGLAPATVAQRLSAVRWMLALLDDAGVVDWSIRIRSPKIRGYRDTRGPSLDEIRALRAAATVDGSIIGRRDLALLGLLFALGLRRGEVTSLRVADWDGDRCTLDVLGKARDEREKITVPPGLSADIAEYLAARGTVESGSNAPLIAGHGPRSVGGALRGEGIRRALARLSSRAGLKTPIRPHGLRHASITAALDIYEGDVRRVARFSRHSKIETVLVYDDKRRDGAAEVSATVEQLVRDEAAPDEETP